ncbi:HAD family hydrolase [Olivibacter sp. XZL3]|uniref:KdsC family phosphatase n=1 Tax=Olivibacter sp. XZL3 TaxID=1735116 RepID=UPI0010661D07|nr:HAD-IIIA family hydrolase [Olivibacter sp. XZL3]
MLFEKLRAIKAFALDVDGVLTNGQVLVNEEGHQLRSFNIRDGYAIQLAVKKNFPMLVITGGRSEGVRKRLQGLGITDIEMGVSDKVSIFKGWLTQYALRANEVLYIGDDIPDFDVMKMAGLAACPNDAAEEIKAIADYVSSRKGGEGAVREIIEKVLKLRQAWEVDQSVKSF